MEYYDLPEGKDYKGKLQLVPVQKQTNNWVKALENGTQIEDFKINSSTMLNVGKNLDILWNMPVPVGDEFSASLLFRLLK